MGVDLPATLLDLAMPWMDPSSPGMIPMVLRKVEVKSYLLALANNHADKEITYEQDGGHLAGDGFAHLLPEPHPCRTYPFERCHRFYRLRSTCTDLIFHMASFSREALL